MTTVEKLKKFLEGEGYECTFEGLEYDINSETCTAIEYQTRGITVHISSKEDK